MKKGHLLNETAPVDIGPGEELLMTFLVCINSSTNEASVTHKAKDQLDEEEIAEIALGTATVFSASLELEETRERFPRPIDEEIPFDRSNWRLRKEIKAATHVFGLNVFRNTSDPLIYSLDCDVLIGSEDNAFDDLVAAAHMLSLYVEEAIAC